ncbi:hypothetical protein PanWU01x14_330010 [Parasponia andersonii]|uniref:Transmembrane protein n=1 Tax=Parasponia andersonii TaxID=3476 RepID=A0A2P5AI86_PARAD|nr:hypothetical protein PanWU01x14_330010 [Parasponia andersonii]
MATTTRLLMRASNHPKFNSLDSDSPSSSSSSSGLRCLAAKGGDSEYQKKSWVVQNGIGDGIKKLQMGSTTTTTTTATTTSSNTTHHEKVKPSMAVAAAATSGSSILITSEPYQRINNIDGSAILDLVSSVSNNVNNALLLLSKRTTSKRNIQMFIERAIIDCRFFTLFAVGGSLLASVLCFVEGCFIVVESYIQYFHNLSHKADQGHVMHLLIEAIDMFLVGTAMLIFGFGLYTMFVGSKSVKEKGPWLAGSNLFGLFYMKGLPTWVGMRSVSQAKSKLGHALMMLLQVGVLEKFKSVPLVTGADLACFAGTVLISSACIFLLSKLSVSNVQDT